MTKLNPVKIRPSLDVDDDASKLRLSELIVRYPTAAQHRDHYLFLRMVATFHRLMSQWKKTSSEELRSHLKLKADFFLNQVQNFVEAQAVEPSLSTKIQEAATFVCTFNGHVIGPWRVRSEKKLAAQCEICGRMVYVSSINGVDGEALVLKCRT